MGAWIAFAVFMWVIGAIFGSISVGYNIWETSNATVLNSVLGISTSSVTQGWGQWVNPLFYATYFSDLYKIVTLDFPIFGPVGGPLQLLRLVFLAPIIACILWGLISTLASILSYILS